MTAKRVGVGAALFLAAAAVVVGAIGFYESITVTGGSIDPIWLVAAGAVVALVLALLLGLAGRFRRRTRLSWFLLLTAAWIAAMVTALGWSSHWPIIPATSATTVEITGTSAKPVEVATGLVHACARMDDGTVWCWGSDSGGQLDGSFGTSPVSRASAAPVEGIAGATAIAASGHTTCVVSGGRVVCWGSQPSAPGQWCSSSGTDGTESCSGNLPELPGFSGYNPTPYLQIDQLQTPFACEPTRPDIGFLPCNPLPGADGVTAIAMTDDHACALDANGRVWCWGSDSGGQLGAGAAVAGTDGAIRPWGDSVSGIGGATAIAVSTDASCATVASESGGRPHIACWGKGAYQAFGLDVPRDASLPFAVPLTADSSTFPVSPWLLCGPDPTSPQAPLGCDRFVRRSNDSTGWMGNSTMPDNVPQPITTLVSGWGSTCALTGGTVWCWGLDMGGGNPLLAFDTAHAIPDLVRVTSVAPAGTFTCAIADGAVRCWGLSSSGQLGVPYAAGIVDLLSLGALAALALAAGAGAYAAVARFLRETRRMASVALGPDARVTLARAAMPRFALAVAVSVFAYFWVFAASSSTALDRYPFSVAYAALAGSVLAMARDARSRGVHRRAGAIAAGIAVGVALASTIAWVAPSLIGVFGGTLPQPIAGAAMLTSIPSTPLALVGLLVFWVRPVDPLLARDFRTAYREARTPGRQLSLLLHPLRFWHDRTVERERARLAAELHAGVLPGLYRSLREVEAGGSVERLALDLREAVDEVEGILASRRSILLDETGLLGAVEWLAERTEERSSVTVEIDVGDETESARATGPRPPRKVERAAFRVAQLALDNCARHAPGSTATVRLSVSPANVRLSVADDGPGLAQTPADAARNGRSGLADMEDEARSCGARLRVTPSDAGAGRPGVTVTFEWRA